ncbi:MAG: hypothetical protein NVSMB33_09070 [Ktedonobacteraceae bacterium]
MTSIILQVTLAITGFLCLLNCAFAYAFRKRRMPEILSYIVVGLIELAAFTFALGIRLGLIHGIPFHLPPHLPFNRIEIGAALAIGIGLFPAAYWHRTSAAQIRAKMVQDAKIIKEEDGGVHVRSNVPGEWMN